MGLLGILVALGLPSVKRQLALRTRAPLAAKNFKFSQTCGHLFQAGRPMRVYAVPAVIRLRLAITVITTPLRRVVAADWLTWRLSSSPALSQPSSLELLPPRQDI
jgi:hypothetical protein